MLRGSSLTGSDEVPLLKEFHKANNIAAHLYDELMHFIAAEEFKGLTKTTITFKPENKEIANDLDTKTTPILEWLSKNEFTDEICEILTKHIALSVLGDFLNFTYESLNSAKKGKLTVAYSLLRKPFLDELNILEQLLIDGKEFVHRFYHIGNPKNYDPSTFNKKNNFKDIIALATNKLTLKSFFCKDQIYRIRYDKNTIGGFNGKMNRAIHIVTNIKPYNTLNKDLNFVFDTPEQHYELWKHYYFFTPLLLTYASCVADELLLPFLSEKNEEYKLLRILKKIIACELLLETTEGGTGLLDTASEVSCNNCQNNFTISRPDFELFFETYFFMCPKCFNPIELDLQSLKDLEIVLQQLNTRDHDT